MNTTSVSAGGATFTSEGASNNFLQLNLDVDQALADIFLRGVNPFSVEIPSIGVAGGSADLIDLDLGASGPARRFFGHPLTYLVPLVGVVGALPAVRSLLRPPPVDADGVALPVADLVWAVVRRTARGQSPFQADAGHIHHRLLRLGLGALLAQGTVVAFVAAGIGEA